MVPDRGIHRALEAHLNGRLGWSTICAQTYGESMHLAMAGRQRPLILQLQAPVSEAQDMMTGLQTASHCPAVLLYEVLPDGSIHYSISDPETTPTVRELEAEFLAALEPCCRCKKVYFRSTLWDGDVALFAEKAGRVEALKEILRGCPADEIQVHRQQYLLDLKDQGYYLYFWELQMIEFVEHRTYKDIYNFLGRAMEMECKAAIDTFNGGEVFYINLLLLCIVINELPLNSQAVHDQRMENMLHLLAKATGCKTATRFLSEYLPNLASIRKGYEDYMDKAALTFFVREDRIMRSAQVDRKRKPATLAEIKAILDQITKYLRYDAGNPKLLSDLRILYLDILKPSMSFTKYYFSTASLLSELSRLDESFDEHQMSSKLNPNMVMYTSIEEQYQNMLQLVQNLRNQISGKYKTKRSLLLRAINYIEENYNRGITVSDITGSLYVSGVYLSKVFSSELHMSVIEYLIQYRVGKAKTLLEETDDPVYVVAEKVGFKDARHFSKTFKRITGETPVEHRRSFAKDGAGTPE